MPESSSRLASPGRRRQHNKPVGAGTAPEPVAPAAVQAPAATLGYLPIALFGSVMGLSGLAMAWRQATGLFGAPEWPSQVLTVLAVLAFCVLAGAYAVKSFASVSTVRNEFANPVAGPLFGTPVICLLLLPLLLAPYSLPLARVLWCVGTIAMIVLACSIVDRWIRHRQQNPHAVPAWFVPVVGMIEIPLAVPALHWTQLHGLMVFGLAVGLFFALPLFTIVFARLMFEEPIAPAMQPSLLILVAPFSVGFIAYVTTLGRIDTFAEALYGLMLFLLVVVLGRLRHLGKCCPFRVGWWAASFPLASSAGAALRYAGYEGSAWTAGIALALLAIATAVILALLAFTIKGVVQGDLQRLSGP